MNPNAEQWPANDARPASYGQAQEQVRHYEGLLAELHREWGNTPRLTEIVRRLG